MREELTAKRRETRIVVAFVMLLDMSKQGVMEEC